MAIQELTSSNFDETLQLHSFILIDFWAEWCGPCKAFSRAIEEVLPRYPEFLFASVNVETEKELANEFSVRSIPFVMIIRDRVIVYAESGALSSGALSELLDQAKMLREDQLKGMEKMG